MKLKIHNSLLKDEDQSVSSISFSTCFKINYFEARCSIDKSDDKIRFIEFNNHKRNLFFLINYGYDMNQEKKLVLIHPCLTDSYVAGRVESEILLPSSPTTVRTIP